MANTYCVAPNTGAGFYTNHDRKMFDLEGHPGDVWVVSNNNHGISWINRVNGTAKVKAEAQAIVDGEIETAQAAWDASPPDASDTSGVRDNTPSMRPEKYILP